MCFVMKTSRSVNRGRGRLAFDIVTSQSISSTSITAPAITLHNCRVAWVRTLSVSSRRWARV
ncbi:hypothetical protein D3C80_1631630 [compost metagenome]